jgi:beta-mannosidase
LKNFEKFDAGNNIENLDWAKLTDEYCLQKFLMDIFVPKSQKTLAEYISDSQKYQAQLTKFYIEFLRKLKYKPCGGILQFMFVDAYPAISWAIVDFWRTKKLAYDICKMCFNPVHIFSDFPKDYYTTGRNYSLKIYVVNDLHKYLDATAHWWVKDEKSSHPVVRGEKRIKLEPDSVQFVQKIRWSPVRRGSYKLCLKLKYDGKEIVNLYDLQVAR